MKKILKNYFYFFIYLFIFGTFFQECFTLDNIWDKERKENAKEIVRDMFYHAYNNYMNFAFPHDELKPLSSSWTDSFVELGTLQSNRHVLLVFF